MKDSRRLLSWLLSGICLCAQQPDSPVYRTQTPIVILPTSVYDRRGQLIDTLSESDFTVLDNGRAKPVHVDLIGTYRAKIDLVVVIQTSGISQAALLKIQKTGNLIDGYITGEDGKVAILGVDDSVHELLSFNSEGDQIYRTFRKLKAADSEREACTLDGVKRAIAMLNQQPAGDRRLILTIGETRDRGSKARFPEVLLAAQQANATIYALTYSAYLTPFTTKASEYTPPDSAGLDFIVIGQELAHLAKTNIAEALARTTGGSHLSFTTLKALENDMAVVGKEVHHQYLLSLTPDSDARPSYHSLTVSVKDQPRATIHTRAGYWSVQ
jgi:VWFA-related protein